MHADTVTPVDFTKIVPTKFQLLFSFQSALNLFASVDSPFSQGKPATTARCRRCTTHRKLNRYMLNHSRLWLNAESSNHSKTLYTTDNVESRMHGNTIARNNFEN